MHTQIHVYKSGHDTQEWLRVALNFSLHFIDLLPFTIALSHSLSHKPPSAHSTLVYARGCGELGMISISCSVFTISAIYTCTVYIHRDISCPAYI